MQLNCPVKTWRGKCYGDKARVHALGILSSLAVMAVFFMSQFISPCLYAASPVITSPSGSSLSVQEGSRVVVNLSATDADNDTLTWSIIGGVDRGRFVLDLSSDQKRLLFAQTSDHSTPDFEDPEDSDKDGTYRVQIRVSDGTNNVDKTLDVTLTNVNESPTISSPSSWRIPENRAFIGILKAKDPEGDALTWSITGGDDESHFELSSGGGLAFKQPKDYESPENTFGDGIYQVDVEVSDGHFAEERGIWVTVQNVLEPFAILTDERLYVREGETKVATLEGHSEGHTGSLTWTITGGADQSCFHWIVVRVCCLLKVPRTMNFLTMGIGMAFTRSLWNSVVTRTMSPRIFRFDCLM